jgi:hypothetical protein
MLLSINVGGLLDNGTWLVGEEDEDVSRPAMASRLAEMLERTMIVAVSNWGLCFRCDQISVGTWDVGKKGGAANKMKSSAQLFCSDRIHWPLINLRVDPARRQFTRKRQALADRSYRGLWGNRFTPMYIHDKINPSRGVLC